MAPATKSTKPRKTTPTKPKVVDGKRVCSVCQEPKSVTAYPSSDAATCSACQATLDDATSQRAVETAAPTSPAGSTNDLFISNPVETDYTNPSAQELASRTLARRKLLYFIKRFKPKYMAGWVHEDICRRLERFMRNVEEGKEPRLLLMMPVRTGKSEIGSRHFAPWVLGHHPDWEIISGAGAQSLALTFSRYIRDLVRDPSYQALFPEMKLDASNQSAENWNTTRGGGYMAAGVGTMITGRGAHCLRGDVEISTTEGLYRLEHLYLLKCPPLVETPLGPRSILAMTKRNANQLFKVRFASGRVLVTTGEHPIYLPDKKQYVSVGEIYGAAKNPDRLNLRVLREVVSASEIRSGQVNSTWAQRSVLREGVLTSASCCEERETLCDVRETRRLAGEKSECKILQSSVYSEPRTLVEEDVSAVRRGVSAEIFNAGVLRGDLRKYGARTPYAWGEELELSHGQRIRVFVRQDAPDNHGSGQRVRCVSKSRHTVLSPHQREPGGQLTGESCDVVQDSSCGASQVVCDTISMVERCCEGRDDVYDLQIEEAGCFFAENILVGNCLIVDDPVKDAEAADSQVIRDSTWEWYISTALSRLAPGGGVLVIMTHWNEDDLAGRLQVLTKMDDGGDKFEIVKYPAINDQGDEYILADDSIEQFPPGSTIPEGARLTRRRNTALHPERYTLEALLKRKATYFALGQQRWWAALYQQAPALDDGVFFTNKMFKFYTADPHPLERRTYQAWDFAITEKQKSDYTVGSTGHVDANNNLHVADIVRFRSDDAYIIADAILDNWVAHGSCATIGFEDGQIWKAVSAVFLRRCDERKLYPSYELLVPLTDKGVRAMPLKGLMQAGKVWFKDKAEWWEETRKELTQFLSGGKHDDAVDSLSWLARLALKHAAPKKDEPKPIKSWKDKLKGLIHGAGGGAMSA